MDDGFTANVLGVADLIQSGTNKVPSSDSEIEGPIGVKMDVLDLPMKDEELLELRDEWEGKYRPYEGRMKPIFERNKNSYLGRNVNGALPDADLPGAANLQFEAEETFLPATLAQNPDPVVYADNSPEGNKIANSVKTMLQFHGQELLLRRKLAVMARQWSIYHLGVLKPGWNNVIKDVAIDNRKIQDFVFDPDGFVDVYGDFSSYLGERITVTAEKLIALFPKHKEYILTEVESKLGTECVYTEWWNDDYCFTTFKKKVLDKHKNEYFNYPEPQTDVFGKPLMGPDGKPLMTEVKNHFAVPKKPYIFLSIFSLQEHPHDITGLIEQNIPNQRKISKRTEQLDQNISESNNGIAFSENNFNQETAKQASDALTKGVGKVLVPQGGPIAEAIVRIPAADFPDAAFKDLQNSENHLRNSWGTQGLQAENPADNKDTTARGMILNQGRDTSRIGGGIADVLEQSVAGGSYNWLVQLYVVFYDVKHFGAVMGMGKATEYVELQSRDINRQLIVGVAPNSMKPKDETAEANMAQALFDKGAIGPKTLLEALDFPNPDEAAADGVLFRLDPMTYMRLNFPEQFQAMQQALQEQAQAQQAAQQQELAMQGQAGEQQLQQKAQAGQQQLQQGAQAHEQKIQQGAELHDQKLGQLKDIASQKLAQVKPKVPK